MQFASIPPQKLTWVKYSGSGADRLLNLDIRADHPVDVFVVNKESLDELMKGNRNIRSYWKYSRSTIHSGSCLLPFPGDWYLVIANPNTVIVSVKFDATFRFIPFVANIELKPVIDVALSIRPELHSYLKDIISDWVKTPSAEQEGIVGFTMPDGTPQSAQIQIEIKNMGPDGRISCDLKKFIEFACFAWKPKPSAGG